VTSDLLRSTNTSGCHDAAEFLSRFLDPRCSALDGRLDALCAADVRLEEPRPGTEFLDERCSRVGIQVQQRNVTPSSVQVAGGGKPKPGAAARDDERPVFWLHGGG